MKVDELICYIQCGRSRGKNQPVMKVCAWMPMVPLTDVKSSASQCGAQDSSSITWELMNDANSWALP